MRLRHHGRGLKTFFSSARGAGGGTAPGEDPSQSQQFDAAIGVYMGVIPRVCGFDTIGGSWTRFCERKEGGGGDEGGGTP